MTGWFVAGASACGAAHVRDGRPNQDALAWSPAGGTADRVVAAVSDGHGAAPHFRSQVGSRIAVECATKLLAWQMDEEDSDAAHGGMAGQLTNDWRAEVGDHVAANPFSGVETLIPRADIYSPYGATLIAAAATAEMIVALQIGDGDLMLGYPGGRIERLISPDTGLTGEETYSLCLPGAVGRFRTTTVWRSAGAAWPDFICLATDGVGKSFHDDDAFAAAIALLRRNAIADWKGLVEALPDWLSRLSERGSGDDATICIALNVVPNTTSDRGS